MLKTKKLLALIVAATTALSFAACTEGDDTDDSYDSSSDISSRDESSKKDKDSSKDEESSESAADYDTSSVPDISSEPVLPDEPDSIPDEIDWGNTYLADPEVKWLSSSDIDPAGAGIRDVGITLFEEKYDGVVTLVPVDWGSRYTKLASLILSDEAPDIFSTDDMDAFPIGVNRGMFQPIDDYVDLSEKCWESSLDYCDIFSAGGYHFAAIIDVEPNYVCIYNTDVMDINGYDQPADLYWAGEWTWDTMKEMAIDFTDQEADKYAFDGWWYSDAISQTSGVPMIGMENGKLINNLKSPELKKSQDYIYELCKNEVGFPRRLNNWLCRDNNNGASGIGNGLTMFLPAGLWALEDSLNNTALYGDVTSNEVMFVPMPSPDGSDPYMPARANGYLLVTGAPNPEGFAAFVRCEKIAADLPENTAIEERILAEEYGWTDEMIEMREECYRLAHEKPVFEFYDAVSTEMSDLFVTISYATSDIKDFSVAWDSIVSEYKGSVDFYVNEANQQMSW